MALAGMHPRTVGRSTPLHAYAWTGTAIGGIWVGVVMASIFAPAMVTGIQHDRLPIASFEDWIFGAIATVAVVQVAMAAIRAGLTARPLWVGLGVAVPAIWFGVLVVSIFTPDFVTGTDPTRLPFGAMLSPIAGSVLTGVVCGLVKAAFARPEMPDAEATLIGVPSTWSTSQQTVADDAAARLRQLTRIRDTGAVTWEEYEAKKRELLSIIRGNGQRAILLK
jgi:hypothetical protein